MQATGPGFTGPPSDPPPPRFQVSDPATFRERLAEVGLKDITVETVTFGLEFPSAAHLWGLLMSSNPMGRMLVADLTEEQRTEVREVLAGMLRERAAGRPTAVLTTEVNIGIATNRSPASARRRTRVPGEVPRKEVEAILARAGMARHTG